MDETEKPVMGKVRIEANGPSWHHAKITLNGVIIPVTKLHILPSDLNGFIRAECEVLVDQIDFPEVEAMFTQLRMEQE